MKRHNNSEECSAGDTMITEIQVYPLLFQPDACYGDANGIKPYRSTVLLRLVTSSGIDGWGECTGPMPMIVYEAQTLNHILYRRDEHNRTEIMRMLREATPRIRAAVDIAWWDLMGKKRKEPIHALLGGAYRKAVPVYASLQSYSQQMHQNQWLRQLLQTIPETFQMVKMKIGALPQEQDCELIRQALDSLPESVSLALDANQSYDETLTRQLLAYLHAVGFLKNGKLRIQWLEEPLPLTQTASYKRLKHLSPVPLAGGENLADSRACMDWVQQDAIDILQPDILHVGGLTELHFLYQYARYMKCRCSPHTFDSGLARVATLHVASVAQPYTKARLNWDIDPIEWDVMENPFTQLFDAPLPIREGFVHIPEQPGLGIHIDIPSLERYIWNPDKPLPQVQPVPLT
jgi:D-galactarolactone cycloisomerase